MAHLDEKHKDEVTDDNFERIMSRSCSRTFGISSCPLCDDSGPTDSPELVEHVLGHIYDFSMYALPWRRTRQTEPMGSILTFNDTEPQRELNETIVAFQDRQFSYNKKLEWIKQPHPEEDSQLLGVMLNDNMPEWGNYKASNVTDEVSPEGSDYFDREGINYFEDDASSHAASTRADGSWGSRRLSMIFERVQWSANPSEPSTLSNSIEWSNTESEPSEPSLEQPEEYSRKSDDEEIPVPELIAARLEDEDGNVRGAAIKTLRGQASLTDERLQRIAAQGEHKTHDRRTQTQSHLRNAIKEKMISYETKELRFVPNTALEDMFRRNDVAESLQKIRSSLQTEISTLVSFVCDKATKIFAILAWTQAEALIEQFYEHQFVDDLLPICYDTDDEGNVKVFSYKPYGKVPIKNHPFNNDEWTERNVEHFCYDDQWPFLSPVFRENHFRYDFPESIHLPFVDSSYMSQKESFFSVVKERRIHRDHLQATKYVRHTFFATPLQTENHLLQWSLY
jgi:hypothetical protein